MSEFPRSFLAWIPPLLRRKEEDIIINYGMDVGMSLIILKNIVFMAICYTFFGIVFVLPVNATASGGEIGLAKYTISNIAPIEMNRYAVHVIGIFWNTLVTCFFALRILNRYAYFRRRVWRKVKLHNYSICLTRVSEDSQEIFAYFEKIFPGDVLHVHKVKDFGPTINLKSKRMEYVHAFESTRANNTHSTRAVPRSLDFCLGCGPLCCFVKRVPAQNFYLGRINSLEDEIRSQQNDAPYTQVAYVTFKHRTSAVECARLCLKIGHPRIAPELYDVRWQNHSISYRTRPIRTWIANTFILLLLIFWAAIIAFATTFSNLNTLANYLPFINYIPLEAKAFIGSIIPPLIIILSFTVLKFLIAFVMDLTGPLSHSKLDIHVFRKLFLFYTINVFLISLFANTFLETWNKIVQYTTELSPIAILLLLASNIGVQSSYFMIYILAQSLTHIIGILHPANIIIGGYKSWSAVTPREKLEASLPAHYSFHVDMAKHCLIFLAIISFSVISPLILPIGLGYLCLIYFQMAFETTYTSFQEYDGLGLITPVIVHRIFVGLFMHQLIMAGMFILSTFYIGLIFCALCILGTIGFIYYKVQYIEKVGKFGLIEDVTGNAQLQHDDGRGYRHPGIWDAAIDLEDINRLSYSLKLNQNQVEIAPPE
jgi:hypothetical protein